MASAGLNSLLPPPQPQFPGAQYFSKHTDANSGEIKHPQPLCTGSASYHKMSREMRVTPPTHTHQVLACSGIFNVCPNTHRSLRLALPGGSTCSLLTLGNLSLPGFPSWLKTSQTTVPWTRTVIKATLLVKLRGYRCPKLLKGHSSELELQI